jgi:UDP-N-acetylglucosamine:LPS N-acetylglucosamine transferase
MRANSYLSVAGPSQDAKAPSGGQRSTRSDKLGGHHYPVYRQHRAGLCRRRLVICRAGASTVTEMAAVGAAALLVPFPSAVDDHQTLNARFLVDQGAAWLLPQSELTPAALADLLQKTERSTLVQRALEAKKMQKIQATDAVVAACEELGDETRG